MHLAPLLSILQRIKAGESVRAVCHAPPRHGKTETLLHFIPWYLRDNLQHTVGYASYSSSIARSKGHFALQLTRELGIPLTVDGVTEWRTPQRGGVLVRGIGEGLTGHGVKVLLIDDPVKDRLQAESRTYQQRVLDWAKSVAFTRVEPGGSIIVNMTRWNKGDLAGHCIDELGFESIVLPALTATDEGGWKSLWPERWSVDEILKIKETVGPFAFESLYQGAPRPRDASVFQGAFAYETKPSRMRCAIGLDLAYSKKTSSDYSVAVVMGESDGVFYVLDVIREQCRAPDFLGRVRALRMRYPTARCRWYAAGTERGTADFFNQDRSIRLEALPPKGDKFMRALGYSAAWNAEKICLPQDPDGNGSPNWVQGFIEEHQSFTGSGDGHDDQIDAAVAAFDVLAGSHSEQRVGMVGKRRL